ncbi:arylsulfatase [Salmonella enterica subsp. arizonae]|uniref:Arylsulfatase n=1 Tax=Salmonella enterica subsp. arizonae TaxID=59203 RepID=A0A379T1G7_SALER|nr:arylsulfatase [Salmonella enterica subsp. arizonae]
MNKKISSMVNLPAPREPINQKIDINNELVSNIMQYMNND